MKYLTDFMKKHDLDVGSVIWAMVIISLIIGLVVVAILDGNQKEKFLKDHNCKVISKESSSVVNTILPSSNGNVSFGVSVISGKTGYKCDDGVIYYY